MLCFGSSQTWGAYALENIPILQPCPFMHQDDYAQNMNRLLSSIQTNLEGKLEGNRRCLAPFQRIAQNLSHIDPLMLNNRNPSLREEIADEVLSKQLMQWELDLLLETPGTYDYTLLKQEIRAVEDRLYQNEIDGRYNRDIFAEYKTNRILSESFNHMNEVVNTLASLPPECVDVLGGWEQLLPTVLSSVSALSGLSGFPYSFLISSGFSLISSLTILLKDINAKRALRDIIMYRNSKILTCTYFAVQHTACEYKRALGISEETEAIKKIILQRYENISTADFNRFFTLLEHVSDFEQVFFDVAQIGSAVTLDTALVATYVDSLRSRPDSIREELGDPPGSVEEGEEADQRRQSWLIAVRRRGIHFVDNANGVILSLKEKITQALNDIAGRLASIRAVDAILVETRSFVDLKHQLDTNPQLRDKLSKYLAFFGEVLEGKIVSTENKGVVEEGYRSLSHLKHFLDVRYSDYASHEDPHKSYTDELNRRGRVLFEVMAEGAIAQISGQTIFVVGRKVQERLQRVFTLLENEFLAEDLRHMGADEGGRIPYRIYRKDHSLMNRVAKNYATFAGTGKTFRSEDVQLAVNVLEKGFAQEIRKLIRESMKTKSRFYPGMEEETASHLCALFSQTLNKKGLFHIEDQHLLRKCKRKFKDLGLFKILTSERMTIDWDDPCFYNTYNRTLSIQKALYHRTLQMGFSTNPSTI